MITAAPVNALAERPIVAIRRACCGSWMPTHRLSRNHAVCLVTATAIIMPTRRMKVGVIGNILPLRHPVQTAEEFAMMDCLSGGRFIGGIVRGVPTIRGRIRGRMARRRRM